MSNQLEQSPVLKYTFLNRRAKLNPLLTGTLSFNNRLRPVLKNIRALSSPGLSVLQFQTPSDSDNALSGEILIYDGKYVCAARIIHAGTPNVVGYNALRLLCGLAFASYLYKDVSSYSDELTLRISLEEIIKLSPGLPERLNVLQNDYLLLNHIFTLAVPTSCVVNPRYEITSSNETTDHFVPFSHTAVTQ